MARKVTTQRKLIMTAIAWALAILIFFPGGRRRKINNPRAARSATIAPTSGATTVTTAPESSKPRIGDRAAGPPPQTSTGSPSSSRLAEKPDGGWICMAA